MDDDTKKVLMIGVPVGIGLLAAVAYFATRPTGENGPPSGDCQDGQVVYQQCPDGSQIITHTCVNGVWVPTGNQCAQPPTPECQEGYVMYETCPDGSQIIISQCINGQWVPTGNQCPAPPQCSPEGVYQRACCYNYKSTLRTQQCTGGQWEPTGAACNPTGDHPPDICGDYWASANKMYLYYKQTYQGEWLPIMEIYNNATGYYESTSFIHSYAELIQTLEYYRSGGAITDIQYQNALAQAASMGFQ